MKPSAYVARKILVSTLTAVALTLPAFSALAESAPPQIKVDIPVVLKEAKVLFNIDHTAFNGDAPVGLKQMELMLERLKPHGTKLSLVGVFHGDGGYMLLNDETYDKVRKTSSGNPYKGMVENLIKQGVEIEACAVTMKGNKWGNVDLLPGVKVNSGALGRIVQLEQEGYVMIQP